METLVLIGFAFCATVTTSLLKSKEWHKEYKVLLAFFVSLAYAWLYLVLFRPETLVQDISSVVFTIFGTATLLYGIFFDRTVFNAYLEAVHLLDAVRRMVPYRNKIPPETELPSDHAYDDTHIATPTAQHDAQHDARQDMQHDARRQVPQATHQVPVPTVHSATQSVVSAAPQTDVQYVRVVGKE